MLTNDDLLKVVAQEGKHTFISTGMSTMDQIRNAVNIFRDHNCPFELLHSNSSYPMKLEEANIGCIETLRKEFNCDVGYSGHELDIKILEIPLVDSSSLKNKDNENQLIVNLQEVIPFAENYNVALTLETDLPPQTFKEFLLRFDNPNVKANYDTGNSASLGYNVVEELLTLGSWIKNIHIKDRLYRGPTVPLGTGDADFDSFFTTLSQINYSGDLIIQGASEPKDSRINPEETCSKYYEFIKQYVDMYL